MTTRKRSTKLSAVEGVAGDRDLMKALMKEALQEVLEGEMTEFLGAEPGERTEARNGYRAGYYGRNLVTRIGKLELRVPRPRRRVLNGPVRALREERESAGRGAGGDVRAGCLHPEG